MQFNENDNRPLFQQVADQIEAAILSGAFKEGEQIPSTTEISRSYQINPATVLKGMNLVVDQGLIEKRRGLGMFVVAGAKEKVGSFKKEEFLQEDITALINNAKKLGISKEQLLKLIDGGF